MKDSNELARLFELLFLRSNYQVVDKLLNKKMNDDDIDNT